MDLKILDRLLAGVEHEHTREDSPDVLWEKRRKNLNRILDEGPTFVAQMQESVESRGFHSMVLNYQQACIDHWHEGLDHRIGLDRIAGYFRVLRLRNSRVADGWS
jgi:hypothetical protein